MPDSESVSTFGTNPAQGIAGLGHAQRAQAAAADRKERIKPAARRTTGDQLDLSLDATQAADAIRSLKGNADEETREDRQEHLPGPKTPSPRQPPQRLDLNG